MRRLLRFVSNMDAKAWRTLAVSFVLFGGVGLVFLFGASVLGFDGESTVEQWLGVAASGPWALPVAVAAFALLAFIGVPQFMLIAAAVVAFGPLTGFAYSWVGTLVSSLVGFWVGRAAGARVLESFAGDGVRRFMEMVGRNGFTASLVVRLVPSAPFIVVNMAAGVTPMRLRDFTAGTALGIVPKIALTAFAGNSIVQAMKGGGSRHVLWLVIVAAIWIGLGWLARGWLRRREENLMLKLFYAPGACSLAPHIALEEAGADYEAVRLDLKAGDQRKPDYLALNPKGRVPALATDRGTLTENPVILGYIAQTFPEAGLADNDDSFAFGDMQAFNMFLASSVHVAFAHAFRPGRYATPEGEAAVKAKVPEVLDEYFGLIEAKLADGRPWVHGERFTVSDPYLYVFERWFQNDGLGHPAHFPRVRAHMQRMGQRAAVRKVLAVEGLS